MNPLSRSYLKKIKPVGEELIDSYAMLLFSSNRMIGLMLILLSFFKPFAGFSALIAGFIAVVFSSIAGLERSLIHRGLYSFNALIIGMGMGALYLPGAAYWIILALLSISSVILSVILARKLITKGLPFLTLPFVICFWIFSLVTRELTALDISTRNIYWLNELYGLGGKQLINFVQFFENLPFPEFMLTFFKSLSSLFFQENVLTGILLFVLLIWQSRIAASLSILGFLTGLLFSKFVHSYDTSIGYYLMNGNFIAVSIALGSFFLIPSPRSYLWAIFAVPFTFMLMIALNAFTNLMNLGVYSFPFTLSTILLLYFIQLIRSTGKLVITQQQFYTPEKNLYHHLNVSKRLFAERYLPLRLPFNGEWIVTQGYDSDITHKGDWSKALDFVIVDAQMKTYTSYALTPENFYCYDKPILAPADGYVQEIIDNIDDNEIGNVNLKNNWGNSIILSHGQGLYTKMSHLKKHSFKVVVGQYVKSGDVLATCGNSGRSPEPHLHFQAQLTPYVGSKTYPYPFQSFMKKQYGTSEMHEFAVPQETDLVSPILVNDDVATAFEFVPGYRMRVTNQAIGTHHWEVFTDAYNQRYLFCHDTGAMAYFNRNHGFFYFTAFYGDKKSILYQFYLSCYKVVFSTDEACEVKDEFPLQWSKNNIGKWLQDLVAPFFIFRRLLYRSKTMVIGGGIFDPKINIQAEATLKYPGKQINYLRSTIRIEQQKIVSVEVEYQHRKITVTCDSTY